MTSLELAERRAVAPYALPVGRAHFKASIDGGGDLALSHCEDPGCTVNENGHAASCGRLACPACGTSGAVLSSTDFSLLRTGEPVACRCGHIWIPLS